jgi:hypothetical protein
MMNTRLQLALLIAISAASCGAPEGTVEKISEAYVAPDSDDAVADAGRADAGEASDPAPASPPPEVAEEPPPPPPSRIHVPRRESEFHPIAYSTDDISIISAGKVALITVHGWIPADARTMVLKRGGRLTSPPGINRHPYDDDELHGWHSIYPVAVVGSWPKVLVSWDATAVGDDEYTVAYRWSGKGWKTALITEAFWFHRKTLPWREKQALMLLSRGDSLVVNFPRRDLRHAFFTTAKNLVAPELPDELYFVADFTTLGTGDVYACGRHRSEEDLPQRGFRDRWEEGPPVEDAETPPVPPTLLHWRWGEKRSEELSLPSLAGCDRGVYAIEQVDATDGKLTARGAVTGCETGAKKRKYHATFEGEQWNAVEGDQVPDPPLQTRWKIEQSELLRHVDGSGWESVPLPVGVPEDHSSQPEMAALAVWTPDDDYVAVLVARPDGGTQLMHNREGRKRPRKLCCREEDD